MATARVCVARTRPSIATLLCTNPSSSSSSSWGGFVFCSAQRAFSTDNSYTGQQIRIERLWREFYFGSAHWRTKEQPDEVMWIEDGGTHAVKKGKQFPLPGWQQLTPNAGTGQAKVSMY